jgi:crotonobetainyl-CoA:carnitine CoA-transferase CaiB-like acyl-CoA transferase
MPPRLGQHTDEVLREHGYSAAQIAALHADKVV